MSSDLFEQDEAPVASDQDDVPQADRQEAAVPKATGRVKKNGRSCKVCQIDFDSKALLKAHLKKRICKRPCSHDHDHVIVNRAFDSCESAKSYIKESQLDRSLVTTNGGRGKRSFYYKCYLMMRKRRVTSKDNAGPAGSSTREKVDCPAHLQLPYASTGTARLAGFLPHPHPLTFRYLRLPDAHKVTCRPAPPVWSENALAC